MRAIANKRFSLVEIQASDLACRRSSSSASSPGKHTVSLGGDKEGDQGGLSAVLAVGGFNLINWIEGEIECRTKRILAGARGFHVGQKGFLLGVGDFHVGRRGFLLGPR